MQEEVAADAVPLPLHGYLFHQLKNKELNKILFCATGALMSPTTAQQNESILGIAHAVSIET